jgi:hypothetical protein
MPQYEIEPNTSYFRSYSDNIVTGSMLPSGKRGYVGSYISGNVMFRSATTSGEYFDLFFNKNASSFLKNTRIFSQEIIYDSIVPNIVDIYLKNGGKFVFSEYDASTFPLISSKKIMKFIFGTFDCIVTASNGQIISDNKWMGSFPFINDYSGIKRMLNPNLQYVSNSYTERSTTPFLTYDLATGSFVSSSNLYYLNIAKKTNVNQYFPLISYESEGSVNSADNFISFPLSQSQLRERQLTKIIFGSKVDFGTKLSFVIEFDVFNPNIRGWKYGLYNGFQTKTNMVFRKGRFGQVRDILEQRYYTKNYIAQTGTIDSPIQINFVSGTQAAITASNSLLNIYNSGIYSPQALCGSPFFDQ